MPDHLPRALDYSTAVRGKYCRRIMREGAHMAVLEPDVAKVFHGSAAVKEGSDCRQPEIAAAGRDPSAFFQIVQKGSDQRCIDLFESQTRRLFVQATLSE